MPRWARRLERLNMSQQSTGSDKTDLLEKLRGLKRIIQELRGQLERAHADAADSNAGKKFGRLVVQDDKQSRYIGSDFWVRISDEVTS